MKKEWRPKEWDKIRRGYEVTETADADGTYEDDFTAGFECGADAMLKVIKKELGKMAFLLEDD